MSSFTGIFQGLYLDFKNVILNPLPMLPPLFTQAPLPPPPPHPPSLNFEEPPMFSVPLGKPSSWRMHKVGKNMQ